MVLAHFITMAFELRDILNTAGPTASLVFASWIFLSVVCQRLSTAMDRYRLLIAELRAESPSASRRVELERQVALYRHRCDLMRQSITVSLIAAEFLLVTVLTALISLLHPSLARIGYLSVGSSLVGIILLMYSAWLMLRENQHVLEVLHSETQDLDAIKSRPP